MEDFAALIKNKLNPSNLERTYRFDLKSAIGKALFFSQRLRKQILDEPNIFEQNVALKKLLNNNLTDDRRTLYFWIIQTWGHIPNFKNHDKNLQKIIKFIQELDASDLSSGSFSTISSLSKVASFLYPDRYAIYDARAIYTLNWLIKSAKEEDSSFNMLFFPIGRVSRNTRIIDHPFVLPNRVRNDPRFYKNNIAYFEYCKLLKELTPILFKDYPGEIFRTEMLLFANIEVAYHGLA